MSAPVIHRWFSLLTVLALACPALAQQPGDDNDRPLERYRQLNVVAAQRTELLVRIQLRAAERCMSKKDTDGAVAALHKAREIVNDDTALTDTRRSTLKRVIKDRLRVARTPPPTADEGALQHQAIVDQKQQAAKRDDADGKKIRQQLINIRALQKAGKNDDARVLVKQLAKDYPDRREVRVAQQNVDLFDQVASAREFRREKARRFDHALNDVDRSSLPPIGDIEFNVKYWRERVQKRAKAGVKYTAKELKILQALNGPITARFQGSRFQDVIDFLQTLTNVPIIVDPDSLKKAEIDDETPVTLNAKGLSLRTVLRFILTRHNLTYVVKDEVIEIVTQDKARSMLTTRAYPIGDLVRGIGMNGIFFGPQVDNFQMMQNVSKIISMIESSVDPDSWKVNGGVGTITFNAATMSLIISNSAEVHASLGTGSILGH